jgi:hypothetical protein
VSPRAEAAVGKPEECVRVTPAETLDWRVVAAATPVNQVVVRLVGGQLEAQRWEGKLW